ncbi:hypothetical protein PG985_009794 [Apiospora marii]|uniref:Rhodopsin domain-containing protein n=1 Tax=Apiospora marii TaxID=335849 RepID=A0ABR1RQK5_9PEZI
MEMQFPPPVNPDNPGRGPMIIGITWTFTIIAVLVVGLRLHVRWMLSKSWALEDWIMLAATACVVANEALITVAYTYGMGKHDMDIEQPHDMVQILKWIWVSVAPGMLVSILARISITLLLVRLFGRVYKVFKWSIIALTTFSVLFCSLLIPFTYVQVTPAKGLWEIYDPPVSKWDPNIVLYMEYIGQSLYTLSDIVFVFWPVLIVWKLQMPLGRKIGLIIMLAGSLVTAVISIQKTVIAQGGPHYTTDAQYHSSLGVLWSVLEENFVIIMGCVPTLHGMAKLDYPLLSSLGSTLSSLVRGSRRGKKSSASSSSAAGGGMGDSHGRQPGGAYRDLEMNKYETGMAGVSHALVGNGPAVTHGSSESVKGLFREAASTQVLRTDEFRVSYDRR